MSRRRCVLDKEEEEEENTAISNKCKGEKFMILGEPIRTPQLAEDSAPAPQTSIERKLESLGSIAESDFSDVDSLNTLVREGTIDQEQGDAIVAFLFQKIKELEDKGYQLQKSRKGTLVIVKMYIEETGESFSAVIDTETHKIEFFENPSIALPPTPTKKPHPLGVLRREGDPSRPVKIRITGI